MEYTTIRSVSLDGTVQEIKLPGRHRLPAPVRDAIGPTTPFMVVVFVMPQPQAGQ